MGKHKSIMDDYDYDHDINDDEFDESLDTVFAEKEMSKILKYMKTNYNKHFGMVIGIVGIGRLKKNQFALSLDKSIDINELEDLKKYAKGLKCHLDKIWTNYDDLIFYFTKRGGKNE